MKQLKFEITQECVVYENKQKELVCAFDFEAGLVCPQLRVSGYEKYYCNAFSDPVYSDKNGIYPTFKCKQNLL